MGAVSRRTVRPAELHGVTTAAVGRGRRLVSVTRLRGGSKKGVYRLVLDDGGTLIAYIWDDAENYWPAATAGPSADAAGPFSPGSGIELFDAAWRRLEGLGVRTPRVLLTDRSKTRYPTDIAVVEDVPGESLETRLERDPRGAETTMARLGQALAAMHQHLGTRFGRVAPIERGIAAAGGSCEQVVLERALSDLADAANREGRIGRSRDRLEAALRQSHAAVPPRAEYRLIHGELGPDHVLVDRNGQPVLIDIEGLMYFDVEWEHVFLRLRFGEHYRWLTRSGLDPQRLNLYGLAMHLSLVAGPLRLLDGDFPDRDGMLRIVEHNLERALAF